MSESISICIKLIIYKANALIDVNEPHIRLSKSIGLVLHPAILECITGPNEIIQV